MKETHTANSELTMENLTEKQREAVVTLTDKYGECTRTIPIDKNHGFIACYGCLAFQICANGRINKLA